MVLFAGETEYKSRRNFAALFSVNLDHVVLHIQIALFGVCVLLAHNLRFCEGIVV